MTIDVIIDDHTFPVIHLHGKTVDIVFIHQHFQNFQFQFLELGISVRSLTQSDNFYILMYCHIFYSAGDFFDSVDFDFCPQFWHFDQINIQSRHHDHYGSIGVLARRHKIPIFANAPTWKRIRDDNTSGRHVTGKIDPDLIRVTDTLFTGSTVTLGSLTIASFPVPHDCPGTVGYRISLGGRTAVVMTDLGYIPRELEDEVLGASVILLESNHDLQMLRTGPYPGYLKNRILSNSGHLSNDAAGQFAVKLARGGTGRIYLGHLSKINNTPGQALATVTRHLIDASITPNRDVELLVAQRETLSTPTRW